MTFKKLIQFQLRADKKLKKYLNIETPLYKMYWRLHVKNLQTKLDLQHGLK